MKDRLFAGLLLAAVLLIYGNALANQFVMDDELYITRNAQVVDPTLKQFLSTSPYSEVFRPLTFATYALNWKFSGPKPFAYHLVNIFLHAGATLLLFILLIELLGSSPEARTVAFVAALLYAVHPIHTEAVDWAVGRAELLAAVFLFAGWILHLRDKPTASLICFALALLSKESAVAFFPLIFVGDYVTGKWKPRVRYALCAVLTAAYLLALRQVQGGRLGRPAISIVDNPLAYLPAGWRILNALRIAWKYVALQIYPAVLSAEYSYNQIPMYRDWRHTLPAAMAAVAVLALLAWALWKKQQAWVLAAGIYFAGFAITANILIPSGTIMGERLAYLPSAGFCLLVALGWNWLRQKQDKVAWGLLAIVVLACCVRTVIRNRDWKDPLTLYTATVKAAPNDAKMHANLAGQYLIRHQTDLAEAQYQAALAIFPDSADTLSSYALLQFQQGRWQNASDMMEKALTLSGRNDLNYDFMVVLYAGILMRTNRPDKAREYLDRETKESPLYGPGWSTRAELNVESGKYAAGRADAQIGLLLNPRDPQALHVMAWLNKTAPVATQP